MALRYEVTLTDEELRTAWLEEERARRGLVRRALGPVLVVLGLSTWISQTNDATRLVSVLAVALGLFHVARPFLAVARVLADRRRTGAKEVVVSLDDDGLAIGRGGKTLRFAWNEVTAAGERQGYIFYEVRGQHRAPIPLRVVPDLDALRSLLKRHTRWVT